MPTPPPVTVIDNRELFACVGQYLDAGQPVLIPTSGSSMLPFIRGQRDRVRVVPAPHPARWQMALVRLPGDRYLLHRIVRVTPSCITLMGDGNLRATEQCAPEDVLGVVGAVIRPDGRETDALGRAALVRGALWYRLRPLRRYLLAIYRLCFSTNT